MNYTRKSTYTPTTDEVREEYAYYLNPQRLAEFDRWLNEIRAEAWDKGFNAGEKDVFMHEVNGFGTKCVENPYRNSEK